MPEPGTGGEQGDSTCAALISAVFNTELHAIRELVRAGTDVNTTSSSGESALTWAIMLGRLSSAKVLVEEGADVNLGNTDGTRPIHRAVDCPDPCAYIALLLEHRANVNAKRGDGLTALHLAAMRGSMPAVIALLEAGGDIDALDRGLQSPLHYAASHDNPEVLETLLRAMVPVPALTDMVDRDINVEI